MHDTCQHVLRALVCEQLVHLIENDSTGGGTRTHKETLRNTTIQQEREKERKIYSAQPERDSATARKRQRTFSWHASASKTNAPTVRLGHHQPEHCEGGCGDARFVPLHRLPHLLVLIAEENVKKSYRSAQGGREKNRERCDIMSCTFFTLESCCNSFSNS